MKISLCLLTLDRHDSTRRTLDHNLARMQNFQGCEWELLWADQNSKDRRVISLIDSYKPAYARINRQNEGVAKAQNQLMLRATGDWIMFFPNDILLPDGWLQHMLYWAGLVKNPGLVGIHCVADLPPLSTMEGVNGPVEAHFLNPVIDKVFGVMFFHRSIIEKIGAHYEGFGVYGLEDSDWNNRITRAGFQSFYIPGLKSEHLCDDVGDKTEYRKMKDESMALNTAILGERMGQYATKGFFEPWPEKRDPL